ncbi:MAG: hypothetical protein AAF934_08205, partial [Bacteroidota bacterium]
MKQKTKRFFISFFRICNGIFYKFFCYFQYIDVEVVETLFKPQWESQKNAIQFPSKEKLKR